MNDKIEQKNTFGDNLVNSTIKKTITIHRAQGFVVGFATGILSSLIANAIWHYITGG
jgi:hypothetical protein